MALTKWFVRASISLSSFSTRPMSLFFFASAKSSSSPRGLPYFSRASSFRTSPDEPLATKGSISGISDDQDGNQVGTGGSPIDALLGPLADNGGPTQTHALRVDSPALDAGSDGLAVSNLPRSSAVAYDRLGRKAAVTQTDPDGIGGGSAPTVAGGFSLPPNVRGMVELRYSN